MINIIVSVLATLGTAFVLLAAVGILRMPDTYLRMAVTTKAATLGVGLILLAAAVYFSDLSTGTRVLAIILFIFLTNPIGAHLIGRASYIKGNKLWEGSVMDDLKGKYRQTSGKVGGPQGKTREKDQVEDGPEEHP